MVSEPSEEPDDGTDDENRAEHAMKGDAASAEKKENDENNK